MGGHRDLLNNRGKPISRQLAWSTDQKYAEKLRGVNIVAAHAETQLCHAYLCSEVRIAIIQALLVTVTLDDAIYTHITDRQMREHMTVSPGATCG